MAIEAASRISRTLRARLGHPSAGDMGTGLEPPSGSKGGRPNQNTPPNSPRLCQTGSHNDGPLPG